MINLSELKVGDSAKIVTIFGNKKIKQRLLQLGLTTGQIVKILSVSVLKKSFLISVRGYALAIRKSNFKNVGVERV